MEHPTQPQGIVALQTARENFSLAMTDAQSLDIVNNVAGAFDAALVISRLEAILSPEVMNAVFMPLMNKKIGFRTDRDPNNPGKTGPVKPYPVDVVRTCIIDAAANGLLPTGNQFNIIAGNMYPTKEGYTALLAKLKHNMGLVYSFEFDPETTVKSSDPSYVAIPCRISYRTNRDDLKGWFKYVAMVKSNGATSTTDQLRGKAERKCKKAFFEFLTGLDLGDGDATETIDATYTEVPNTHTPLPAGNETNARSAAERARQLVRSRQASAPANTNDQPSAPAVPSVATPPQPAQQATQPSLQPNLNFDNMTDEEIDAFVSQREGGLQ